MESGNLTSSLTVLSDLVFVAVYDETKDSSMPIPETDSTGKGATGTAETQSTSQTLSCTFLRGYDDGLKHTHDHYCALSGLDPKAYGNYFEELGDCPYVKILQELYGGRTQKAQPNDFRQTTLIEIEDIANLLKALFKVNIDIAHREYFLKIDIPAVSNWWYGYQEVSNGETKWISFEPAVELKFSNLHSDNQIDEEGNLICSVSANSQGVPVERNIKITPVNRELEYNSTSNKCVQYNDLYYCYDFEQTWTSTKKRQENGNSLETVAIAYNDNQNFYEVKPLCLYENTQLQSPTDANDFIRHRLLDTNHTAIQRSPKQVRTFTSFVKKYRPVIMPQVRDIFNDCHAAS